jgi:hypothetical protein
LTLTGVIAVILFLFFVKHLCGQHIVINEFMADNESTIHDMDGDYNDWIEIYNNGDFPVNLLNFSLSDDAKNPRRWLFPDITIEARGFLLLFASGKDFYNQHEIHTNFRISAEGETLILSNNRGVQVDIVSSARLWEDESLGRYPDGSDNWLVSLNSTPGRTNNTVNHLLYSVEEGFHASPFFLKINSILGDTVYYTTDGNIPDENADIFPDSLFLDFLYDQPNFFSEIPATPPQEVITYKAWESPGTPVHKAHVIRSASFRNGVRTSKVYTHTFFVDSTIFSRYSLPVISLVTEGRNLFDADSGIYVPGKYFDAVDPEWTGNYFNTGSEWEKPVYISYFEKNGREGFSQDAGIRIHGYKSRQASQKSLRFYARKGYGKKSFDYPLLPQKEMKDYRRFILRTTMGDWFSSTIIRDVLAHELSRDLDFEIQDYQPVVVYLNGEYWGIYTLRDRIDEHFIGYTSGADKDYVDLINGNYEDIEVGSNDHYVNLARFIEANDLSHTGNYEYVQTQIDIDNLIDYLIAEMFFANLDWPINNQRLWRPQTPEGKWRWILFDVDAGFSDVNSDMFHYVLVEHLGTRWTNSPVSTFLFDNLLKNEQFQAKFLTRHAQVLKSIFTPTKMVEKIEMVQDLYRQELPHHILRWNFPVGISEWENDIQNDIISFVLDRPCAVERHILDYFNISDFGFSCKDPIDEPVPVADLIIAPNPSSGSFFILNNAGGMNLDNLALVDISGRVIHKEKNLFLEKGSRRYFHFEGLPAGMYFLKLNNQHVSETRNIVIIPR